MTKSIDKNLWTTFNMGLMDIGYESFLYLAKPTKFET